MSLKQALHQNRLAQGGKRLQTQSPAPVAAPLFEPFAPPPSQDIVWASSPVPTTPLSPTLLPLPVLFGWQEESAEALSRTLERYTRRFSCDFAKEEY